MSVKERNRFVIAQNLQGVQAQLAAAVEKTDALYADPSSSITEREAADAKVLDLTNRVNKFKKDLEELDAEAAARLNAEKNNKGVKDPKNELLHAKATLVRNTMAGKPIGREVMNVLGDGSSLGEGQKILPSTMLTSLVAEPYAKNPLRGVSTFTNITNLEIPKINFTLADDEFLTSDTGLTLT